MKPGDRFGKLTILRDGPRTTKFKDNRKTVIVKCDCGAIETVVSRYISRGDKKACVQCTPSEKPVTELGALRLEVKDLRERIEALENNKNLTDKS